MIKLQERERILENEVSIFRTLPIELNDIGIHFCDEVYFRSEPCGVVNVKMPTFSFEDYAKRFQFGVSVAGEECENQFFDVLISVERNQASGEVTLKYANCDNFIDSFSEKKKNYIYELFTMLSKIGSQHDYSVCFDEEENTVFLTVDKVLDYETFDNFVEECQSNKIRPVIKFLAETEDGKCIISLKSNVYDY